MTGISRLCVLAESVSKFSRFLASVTVKVSLPASLKIKKNVTVTHVRQLKQLRSWVSQFNISEVAAFPLGAANMQIFYKNHIISLSLGQN